MITTLIIPVLTNQKWICIQEERCFRTLKLSYTTSAKNLISSINYVLFLPFFRIFFGIGTYPCFHDVGAILFHAFLINETESLLLSFSCLPDDAFVWIYHNSQLNFYLWCFIIFDYKAIRKHNKELIY